MCVCACFYQKFPYENVFCFCNLFKNEQNFSSMLHPKDERKRIKIDNGDPESETIARKLMTKQAR